MLETTLRAPELEDDAGVQTIQRALASTEGLAQLRVDRGSKTVTVLHDPELLSVAAIQTRLDHVGFLTTVALP
ncbi:heavy-metal-associated domain-containing protein [Armatimonas rosea]|uniref:HMA domain-containing protein n=1 Tax=Armatimonas rosea TaxID=685828 RepID=A0A7W9SNX7_ARMRO|nr:heavy metal-associated domain-containing protein [Armatimonas rosea]MBB6049333.1 hypothetical protein [Armatimonas rosea]